MFPIYYIKSPLKGAPNNSTKPVFTNKLGPSIKIATIHPHIFQNKFPNPKDRVFSGSLYISPWSLSVKNAASGGKFIRHD